MQFKKITPDDKPRVLEISKNIWEGDDYIHEIFDKWVFDPFGMFEGLHDEEKLIAYARMTYITPTDVWLEGLRKDTKIEIKGIGTDFLNHFLGILATKHDIRSVRFSTYFENYPSIISSERAGFRKILTCSLKNFEMIHKAPDKNIAPELTKNISFADFMDYIEKSEYKKRSNGLLSKGWILYIPEVHFYADFYTGKKFIVYVRNNGILGALLYSKVHYSDSFWITFLEAINDDIRDQLFWEALRQAQRIGKKVLQILIPDSDILMQWARSRNFTSWQQEHDLFVYELPLPIHSIQHAKD